jgi:hypothetical protein
MQLYARGDGVGSFARLAQFSHRLALNPLATGSRKLLKCLDDFSAAFHRYPDLKRDAQISRLFG